MAISYGTYTITEVQEGSQIWTSSAAPTTPNYTFDVSHLTGDSDIPIREGDIILNSYYRYTVLSISSDGTTVLTGNRTSIRGATGAASVTYALIVSNLAIVKDKDGNLSPSTITVTAKSQTGSNAMANYTGRIKIETTTNGTTWTTRSSEDLATKTYTIPSDTIAIRCSLYLKGGETTLLDQQTVPVVSDGTDGIDGTDGKDGADGKDAYTVILTNENHTFAGNTTSAVASEIECNVIAYKGATQIAATIGTITGQPTGMTTSLLNNGTVNAAFKVNVTTSMVTKNGVLTVPITVDGKSFTKEFTYTLTLDGEKGDKGDRGTNGASQNLLLDAYAPSLAKVDAPSARYFSDASNSTITGQFIAEDNLPDPNATHFVRLTDSSASTKGRGLCFYSTNTPPFINGHTYRIGCWVRKHAGSPKMNITLDSHGSWMPTQRIIDNTDWEWIEVVRTFGDTTSADKTPIPDTYKRLYFYFYNNNVAGSSLDMCGFRMEELQTNSGTARNLLLDTEKLTNWGVVNGATISDGVASFPSITANSWREIYPAKNFKYELIRNQYAIFSIKVKGNVDEKCCVNLCIGVDTTETAYARKKYFSQYIYFIGTGEWQTVCSALPIFDYMFNTGSGTVDFDNCWVTVRIGAVSTYHNGFQAKEPQLCLGTTATSWTPAPEDIEASAVTEEQYIYIQATSGTNSVSPKTEWVTEDGESATSDTEGLTPQWTTKRPTYRSNYPVIFIAKQRKTVDGTITCTTPTKDDTLTIIDGGHITTGTIDASKVTVTNIDAGKITTGTLNADRINTKSISIGDFKDGDDYAKTEDVNTAINNIEIGGRNLVWNSNFQFPTSSTWANWGSPTTREVVTINGENWLHLVSSGKYQGYEQNQYKRNGIGEIQAGDKIIFSYDAYAKVDGQIGCIGIHWRNADNENVTQSWASFNLTTTRKRYTTQVYTVPNNVVGFNIMIGQSVTDAQEIWITNIKAEKGNKATDWTPAPEDVNDMVSTVQTNADAVNLSPYFSYSPYVVNDYWKSWSNQPAITFTEVGDGWVRIQCTNTSTSTIRKDFYPTYNLEIKEGTDYTWLIEFRNNQSQIDGTASGSDFYLVQTTDCQFWGGTIKENLEGMGTDSTTRFIDNIPIVGTEVDGITITKDYVYKKRFIKTSEATGSSRWTDGSADNLRGLACFTARCAKNTTIDCEARISLYEGRYLGEYKPYIDSSSTSKIDIRTGWNVLINVSAIDYLSNTATLHATVYKDGIVQTSGFTLQWYKTYTTTNITPEETTTQLITGATTDTLNVTDLDASYTCIVS